MEELYKDGGTEAVCADVRTVWGSGLAWGTKNTLLQILHIYHQRKASNPWILTFNELNWENVFLLKASPLIYTVLIVPLYSSISLPAFICQLLFASTKLCHHQSVQQPHRAVITCRWLSADMKHRRAEIFRQKRTKWRRLKCRSICNKTHLRSQSSASLCTNLFLLGGDSNYT